MVDGKGLSAEDIAHFPSDSLFAGAISVDTKNILDEFTSLLVQFDPYAAEEMARGFIEFQSETGVDLRRLIGNFGPAITLHNGYGDGLITGTQLRSQLEDPQRFEEAVEAILALFIEETGASAAIDSLQQNGKTVKSLHFGIDEPIPFEPSWLMEGDRMTLALFPSVLSSATNPDLASPLVKEPSFAPYLELFGTSDRKMLGFAYLDSSLGYQMLYGYACMGGAMGRNMELREFMPLGPEQSQKIKEHFMELQLPSYRSIGKHLTPEVAIVYKQKDAIVFESHSMMANSNLTMAAPAVAVGLLLPAVQQVRAAARRVESMNNLRQLALAAHNYESAFSEFPSGDGPMKPNGPPVSWRVKLLPFIEGQNLHDMYNFDEPWDSENNMKVAKLMPEYFRNPASNAPEGHTVYRGVGGVSGVMGVDQNKKSESRSFSAIADGS